MICMHCGAEIDEHTVICPYCDMPGEGNPEFKSGRPDVTEDFGYSPAGGDTSKKPVSAADMWSAAAVITGILTIIFSIVLLIALLTSKSGFSGNMIQTIDMVLLFGAGILSTAGILKPGLLKLSCGIYILALADVIYNALTNSKSSGGILIQLVLMAPAVLYVIKSRQREETK